MGRTACTEPQCLYKGALYFYFNFGSTFREKRAIKYCTWGLPRAPLLDLVAVAQPSYFGREIKVTRGSGTWAASRLMGAAGTDSTTVCCI